VLSHHAGNLNDQGQIYLMPDGMTLPVMHCDRMMADYVKNYAVIELRLSCGNCCDAVVERENDIEAH